MRNTDLIYLLAWSAVAGCMVVVPLLAKELGATSLVIGLITAGYGLTNLISYYVFGRMADMRDRKLILSAGLLAAAAVFFMQVLVETIEYLFVIRLAAGFAIGVFPAAIMAYAHADHEKMGAFSGYGSLGWAVGFIAAAILKDFNLIFAYTGVALFAAFLVSLGLKSIRFKRLDIPLFPIGLIKKNKGVYLPFFLRHTGANMIWVIFPIYLLGLGASFTWISILYLINTGSHFLIMPHLDSRDNRKLIRTGMLLSAVVFTTYAFASDYIQLIPVQLLLGLAWSTLYVGGLNEIMSTNREKATVAGILNSIQATTNIIGPLAGGIVAYYWGMRSVMLAAAVFSLAAYFAANIRTAKQSRLGFTT